MSTEGALAELRRCAGDQFDSRVVEAFAVAMATSRVLTKT
jgi:HD-GYP domain-containing protein (c-di-GMP phosphodiesterase class II)